MVDSGNSDTSKVRLCCCYHGNMKSSAKIHILFLLTWPISFTFRGDRSLYLIKPEVIVERQTKMSLLSSILLMSCFNKVCFTIRVNKAHLSLVKEKKHTFRRWARRPGEHFLSQHFVSILTYYNKCRELVKLCDPAPCVRLNLSEESMQGYLTCAFRGTKFYYNTEEAEASWLAR